MPYPHLLHPEPLPLWQSTADLYLHRRHSNTVLSQSLWGLWVLVHIRFEPSKHLWRVWDLILNAISPLLPSCWGFSFALGCGAALEQQLHWCWSDFEEIPHTLRKYPMSKGKGATIYITFILRLLQFKYKCYVNLYCAYYDLAKE